MTEKYLIDTRVWIDTLNNRTGYLNEKLGSYAMNLLIKILSTKGRIVITDILIFELENEYNLEEIESLLNPFRKQLEKILVSEKQFAEAKAISAERNLPLGDVLHAVVSRDNDAILITRNNHFSKLKDITSSYKPEEIIDK